ncbi:MAG: flippase [Fusobacteriaceae bacterium]
MSKIVKNYILNIIIVFANIIFPMLLFPYASRVLTAENYGKYSFALSVTSYFITLANLGVQSYGLRELARVKSSIEEFKREFSGIFMITMFSSVLSFFFYLAAVYLTPSLQGEKELLLVMGLTVILAFMNLDYLFMALENHKRRTMRLIVTRGVSLIFLLIFVRKPQDYIIFAIVMIIPEVLVKIADMYSIRSYLNFKIEKSEFRKHVKPLLIIFFYILSQTAYLNLDSTMLGILKGNQSVGFYSVSIKMVKIVLPIIASLGVVLSPRIIENIKHGRESEVYRDMEMNLNFIFFMTLPAALLMFVLADNLIIMLSGNGYMASIAPMRIMIPVIIFISISSFASSQVLIPTNNEKKVLKVALIGLGINLILNLILIPKYSILGAAVATLIAEFIVCYLRTREIDKIFPNHKILSGKQKLYIYPALLAFLVAGGLKYFNSRTGILTGNVFVEFILIGIIYKIIYVGWLICKKEYFTYKVIEILKSKLL